MTNGECQTANGEVQISAEPQKAPDEPNFESTQSLTEMGAPSITQSSAGRERSQFAAGHVPRVEAERKTSEEAVPYLPRTAIAGKPQCESSE